MTGLMRLLLSLHVLTVAVASSYLTLGIVTPHHARALWAPYALVTFVLAIANLLTERRHRR